MFGILHTTHRWCLLGTLWFDLVKAKNCVPSFIYWPGFNTLFSSCILDHLLVSCHFELRLSCGFLLFLLTSSLLRCLHVVPCSTFFLRSFAIPWFLSTLLCDPRLLGQVSRFTLETPSNRCILFSGQEDWPQSTGGVMDCKIRKKTCSAIMCGKMPGGVWPTPCLQDSQNTCQCAKICLGSFSVNSMYVDI